MRDHHPYTIVAARFLPPTRFSAHNAGSFFAMPIQCLLVLFIRCCQTNRLKHHKPGEREFYEAIRERHSVRAASRFSLKLVRVESDLCELK